MNLDLTLSRLDIIKCLWVLLYLFIYLFNFVGAEDQSFHIGTNSGN